MKAKYAILLITMFAINYTAFCGDGDGPFKRVYFGVSFTPDLSSRYLHSSAAGNPGYTPTNINDYNSKSIPEFGANVDFKVGINLTHWLAIESGVGYSLIQYHFNTSQYNMAGNDSVNINAKETYHYMAVPLGLRFSMGHHAVRGIIATGVDFDFLIKQTQWARYDYADGDYITTNTLVATKNFNTFNVSPYLGAGIDCYMGRSAIFRIMPVAQIQSLKDTDQPLGQYLWNVGINFSLLFGL